MDSLNAPEATPGGSRVASMKGELAFYPEIDFHYSDAANNNEQQITDIEAFINQRGDLLIVSPNEAAPITPVVEEGV